MLLTLDPVLPTQIVSFMQWYCVLCSPSRCCLQQLGECAMYLCATMVVWHVTHDPAHASFPELEKEEHLNPGCLPVLPPPPQKKKCEVHSAAS